MNDSVSERPHIKAINMTTSCMFRDQELSVRIESGIVLRAYHDCFRIDDICLGMISEKNDGRVRTFTMKIPLHQDGKVRRVYHDCSLANSRLKHTKLLCEILGSGLVTQQISELKERISFEASNPPRYKVPSQPRLESGNFELMLDHQTVDHILADGYITARKKARPGFHVICLKIYYYDQSISKWDYFAADGGQTTPR